LSESAGRGEANSRRCDEDSSDKRKSGAHA
jgi:hypothetical protein